MLEDAARRIMRYLRKRGLIGDDEGSLAPVEGVETRALAELAATAASGITPPAGPAWKRGALPPLAHDRDYDRHLSVARGGFTLHAATRAGAMDERGRETLLKYVLRPAVAHERITHGPEGLMRIGLKKKFSDGTFAVDLDPLSILTRLCASVPPPRFHTVRYAGVLASASKLRSRILPEPPEKHTAPAEGVVQTDAQDRRPRRCRYRPWAELMMRTLAVDVLCCPRCSGRLRLVALMTEPKEIRSYLRALGDATEAPARSPARGPPFWASRALRRHAGDVDAA
ncbi:MAG: transposase [Labilithrix sp.]|nr:transposase [Labilithrix sp.]